MKVFFEDMLARGSNAGQLASVGTVFLFVTLIGIIVWTLRPSAKAGQDKMARITVD